jgi:CrcB protein
MARQARSPEPGTFLAVLLVGAGGAAGANARYLLGREISGQWPTTFPWGTLLVNVSGCLALGVLIGWLVARGDRPVARLLIATGFLGAYTTFSTFAYETVRLLEDGRLASAIAYVAASLVFCLGAAAGGITFIRATRAV